MARLSRTVHNALRVGRAQRRVPHGAHKEGAEALTWESFSEARGEDGLVHVAKHGDKDALCGVRVLAGDIGGRRRCPKCRSLRRGAIRQSSGGWVPE